MLGLSGCSTEKSGGRSDANAGPQVAQATESQSPPGDSTGDVSQFAATGCDASLWNHVYNPSRLQQLAPCVAVTGIVEESSADDDGDQHFLLKLDPGQDAFLNKRNVKKKTGDLVLEIVCANPARLKKARSACANYTNPIAIPSVGTHIKVSGTLVIDSHNGWAEIHPVSRMQQI